jgi:hypothetical protein
MQRPRITHALRIAVLALQPCLMSLCGISCGEERSSSDASAQRPAAASEAALPEPDESTTYARWPDPLADMPRGDAQRDRVCERPARDSIHTLFCGDQPAPTSLSELQARLQMSSDEIQPVDKLRTGDFAGLSITGHSSALSRRSVSAINPRLVAVRLRFKPRPTIGDEDALSRMLALAFARGEQFAEAVANDEVTKKLNFYVISFRQACNDKPEGCTHADLLTPAIESDWTETTLYDETDLANTVLDCAPCHQPDGPEARKMLRMQELDSPWTHWFSPSTEGGRALLDEFLQAHGDEPYGGMSSERVQTADPNSLASFVFLDTPVQPNEFDSTLIETEVKQSAAAEGGEQPFDNSVPGSSSTWATAFERAGSGEAIAVPYYNVKVADADKLADMTRAYQAFRAGELPAEELPDIRAVFPDDPTRLAQMGIGTLPGLSGREVLMTACSQCHNERLDQNLSRARFRADLEGMDRAEKEVAIARLQLPPEHPLAMPPARLRVLTREARERAISALRE